MLVVVNNNDLKRKINDLLDQYANRLEPSWLALFWRTTMSGRVNVFIVWMSVILFTVAWTMLWAITADDQ